MKSSDNVPLINLSQGTSLAAFCFLASIFLLSCQMGETYFTIKGVEVLL